MLDDTRYVLDELEMLYQHLMATAIPITLLLNEAMLRLASAYRAKVTPGITRLHQFFECVSHCLIAKSRANHVVYQSVAIITHVLVQHHAHLRSW